MKRRDVVDIAGELRHQTAAAYLFFDGTTEVWLPKSQAEWYEDDDVMSMPEWLAKEKGLI